MNLDLGMAKKYVDDLSDNVKRGNKTKLEKGWLPGRAPLGYLNHPTERIIVPDPERFPLVRKMWDLLLAETRPLKIRAIANNEWGFRTRKGRKTGNTPLSVAADLQIVPTSLLLWPHHPERGSVSGKAHEDDHRGRILESSRDIGKERTATISKP